MTDTTATQDEAPAAEAAAPQAPMFSVVRGDLTAEELSALVLVVAAAAGGEGGEPAPERSLWAHRGRGLGLRSLSQRSPNRAWAWRSAHR